MSELIAIALVLLVLLAIVTFVGHGIWVLLATILRALFANPAAERAAAAPSHAGGGPTPSGNSAAPGVSDASMQSNGFVGLSKSPTPAEDHEATERHVHRLLSLNLLHEKHARQLLELLRTNRSLLTTAVAEAASPASRTQDAPVNSKAAAGNVVLEAESASRRDQATNVAITPAAVASNATGASEPEEEIFLAEAVLTPTRDDRPASDGKRQATVQPTPQSSRETPSPAPHPLDRSYQDAPRPGSAGRPRRALANVLQAFMEDRNIRWGELISGMLIVSSAVGLIISLRQTLEAIPYFQAFLFLLFTAAVHAAGNYTLHRWKLATTSRGMLIIGTLLVPLSFLAGIEVSGASGHVREMTDPVYWLAVGVGLAAFGAMVFFASKALLGGRGWRLFVAVMVPCAAQLIINRVAGPALSGGVAQAWACIPLLGLVAAMGDVVWQTRNGRLQRRSAERLVMLLGIGTFSYLAATSLLAIKLGTIDLAWKLAPSLHLASVLVLVGGAALQQSCRGARLQTYRTGGLALALLGGLGVLLTAAFAWPETSTLMAVAALGGTTLLLAARLGRLPTLYAPAVFLLSLGWIIVVHVAFPGSRTGDVASEIGSGRELLTSLWSGHSAAALLAPVVVGLIGAVIAGRSGDKLGRRWLLVGSGLVSVLSLLVALWVGFINPQALGVVWVPPLLAAYAIALFAVAWRIDREDLTWAASGLLFAAILQGASFNPTWRGWAESFGVAVSHPWLLALAVHSLIVSWTSVFLRNARGTLVSSEEATGGVLRAFHQSAALTAMVTAVACAPACFPELHVAGLYALAATAAWLGVLLGRPNRLTWSLTQGVATFAVTMLVAGAARRLAWWQSEWWTPGHLWLQTLALGAMAAAWLALAKTLRASWRQTISPRGARRVEHGLLVLAAAGMVALAFWGVIPGVQAELTSADVVASVESNPLQATAVGEASDDQPVLVGAEAALIAAQQPLAWGVLAVVVAAGAIALADDRKRWLMPLALTLGAAVVMLVSVQFAHVRATATAVRWGFALFALATASVAGWTPGRSWLAASDGAPQEVGRWPRGQWRHVGVWLGGLIVVGITSATVAAAVIGQVSPGPAADSWLGRLPNWLLYGGPLLLLVTAAVAQAVREGRARYLLAGSALVQYAAAMAYFLFQLPRVDRDDLTHVAGCWQFVTLGLVGFTLVWLLVKPRVERAQRDRAQSLVQVAATNCVLISLVAFAVVLTVLSPASPSPVVALVSSWPTWAGLAATLLLTAIGWTNANPRVGWSVAAMYVLVLSALAALSLITWDGRGTWLTYHGLMVNAIAVAGTFAVAAIVQDWLRRGQGEWGLSRLSGATVASGHPRSDGFRGQVGRQAASGSAKQSLAVRIRSVAHAWVREPQAAHVLRAYSVPLCLFVAGLAIVALNRDPLSPWTTVAAMLGGSAVLAGLGIQARRQWLAYLSTIFLIAASIMFWADAPVGVAASQIPRPLMLSLLATVVASFGWLVVDVYFQRTRREVLQPTFTGPSVHHLLPLAGTVILLLVVAGGTFVGVTLGRTGGGIPWSVSGNGSLLVCGALLAFWAASLWDNRCRIGLVGIYGATVASLLMAIDRANVTWSWGPSTVVVAIGLSGAMVVAATGHLWHFGANLADWGRRLGIERPVEGLERTARWLPIVNLLVTAVVVLVEFCVVLQFEPRWMRISAAVALLPLAYGTLCLAQRGRTNWFRMIGLGLLGLALVFVSWADLNPAGTAHAWLVRGVRLLVAAGINVVLFGPVAFSVLESQSSWRKAFRRITEAFAGLSVATLAMVLCVEWMTFQPGVGAGLDAGHTAAVAFVLIAVVIGLLVMALVPKLDPFGLPERGRMAYVYAAQLLALLLMGHLYLANPTMFGGYLRPYWPYIAMAAAFAGVGFGEWAQRAGFRVLGEPLMRTGTFLPLLPALGMWLVATDASLDAGRQYALVLFAAGGLYALVATLRKQWWWAAAAALAGNGALWSLLHAGNINIWQQPQLWLIPPAACVLIAAHMQRGRLSEKQLAAIRYAGLLVIYLSSVADMLLAGIADSLWPPMILATLSVVGALFGIAFRIRAFLYCGTAFLATAIVAMVAHAYAQLDHVAIWWAFGIALGVTVLALFVVFEKNRTELTRMIQNMRRWDR